MAEITVARVIHAVNSAAENIPPYSFVAPSGFDATKKIMTVVKPANGNLYRVMVTLGNRSPSGGLVIASDDC